MKKEISPKRNLANKIFVTRSFLPPKAEFLQYIDRIWESKQLTNGGSLLVEFEQKIKELLEVRHFQLLANGTLGLQLAIEALEIEDGEIITTPFSYVATSSAILWQKCKPVFVDIDENTLCIDPKKIETAITKQTKAILAVHVFGKSCDIESIDSIARNNKLKVIYDGAHAFGAKYKNKSLLSYGDISVTSFHATKIMHTIEGGGIICKDPEIDKKIFLMQRFGHCDDDHITLGINAKASEFQAAMGLANLRHIDEILNDRKKLFGVYDRVIGSKFRKPERNTEAENNWAYYPIIFEEEDELLRAVKRLNNNNINPRRYFYPSLNKIKYIRSEQRCPISEYISSRVLCLPLYPGLQESDITRICELLND